MISRFHDGSMIQALLVAFLSSSQHEEGRMTSDDKLVLNQQACHEQRGRFFAIPAFLERCSKENLCFSNLSTGLPSSVDDFSSLLTLVVRLSIHLVNTVSLSMRNQRGGDLPEPRTEHNSPFMHG
jgi:hypothetical protein